MSEDDLEKRRQRVAKAGNDAFNAKNTSPTSSDANTSRSSHTATGAAPELQREPINKAARAPASSSRSATKPAQKKRQPNPPLTAQRKERQEPQSGQQAMTVPKFHEISRQAVGVNEHETTQKLTRVFNTGHLKWMPLRVYAAHEADIAYDGMYILTKYEIDEQSNTVNVFSAPLTTRGLPRSLRAFYRCPTQEFLQTLDLKLCPFQWYDQQNNHLYVLGHYNTKSSSTKPYVPGAQVRAQQIRYGRTKR